MRRVAAAFLPLALALPLCILARTPEALSLPAGSVARVLPAAASAAGTGGSFFRTTVLVFNPFGATVTGRFVYHRAGVSGSDVDPGLDFSVGAGKVLAYDDILPAMGQSGLGTLDLILVPAASASPVVVARVFNDGGDAGTSGFTEESIDPAESGPESRVLSAGASGSLFVPSDMVKFRLNIGVRSLAAGATFTCTVRDADGVVVGSVPKSLGPTFFVQQDAATFLGAAPPPGGTIEVAVASGSAIVYAATTDNTTQDPSVQFARAVAASP